MLKVLITIDVETSIGGAFAFPDKFRPVGPEKRIYGRLKDGEYGIPLIMDILEAYGLRGVFFVETLCSFYFGREEIRRIVQEIASRGHEVGLHLHPNYQIFQFDDWPKRAKEGRLFSDFIAHYPLEKQKELLLYGRSLLEEAGINPLSFRAGCFGANNETLKALKEVGFFFDSSFDLSMVGLTCFIRTNGVINDLVDFENIWETPVTNFKTRSIVLKEVLRHLDICAVSFSEMKYILERSVSNLSVVTIILHSFSFLKKRDVQYRTAKPNGVVIKRFEKLCRYLSSFQEKYQVVTYNDLLPEVNSLFAHPNFIPQGPFFLALGRYVTQAWQYF